LRKKMIVLLITMVLVLVIPFTVYAKPGRGGKPAHGPASAKPATPAPSKPATPGKPGTPASGTPSSSVSLVANYTAEDAQNIALEKVGYGTVARTETHYTPRGSIEYHVIIVDDEYRHDVHVSAYNGSITEYKIDMITKTGRAAYQYGGIAVISAEDAKSIAIQYTGSGFITDCKLDYTPRVRTLTYHVHVAIGQYEHCVELDASTGSVNKVEPRYKP